MPNFLKNWKFKDVEKFLLRNNFRINHSRGSHFYFVGVVNGEIHQVTVPSHGTKSINPKTMNSIILQSGINKKEWFKK